jgi:hypothetical protein
MYLLLNMYNTELWIVLFALGHYCFCYPFDFLLLGQIMVRLGDVQSADKSLAWDGQT